MQMRNKLAPFLNRPVVFLTLVSNDIILTIMFMNYLAHRVTPCPYMRQIIQFTNRIKRLIILVNIVQQGDCVISD